MDKIVVEGGRRLAGEVEISGAKNASLAILCASLLAEDRVILENIPNISDIRVMIDIISFLGGKIKWLGTKSVEVAAPQNLNSEAPYELIKKLRASNLLLGPLLARYGFVKIALPGGCNIGVRPMDLHFKGITALGAKVEVEKGFITGRAKGLKGTSVYLDFPSVGATENIMMAACLAEGQTVIENVAKEPEVVDLANFLNSMGARVRGAGTDIIKIEGVPSLAGGIRYSVIPDRIEAGTYMVAAAATGGDVYIKNIISRHLEPLIAKLRETSVEVSEVGEGLHVRAFPPFKAIDIKTMPYPGFPTDMQSQMMALLSVVPGISVIVENIFENRFQVAAELKRLGARIKVEGRTAVIEGVPRLQGAHVKASDLRAGAALIVAGLIAEGETVISNAYYIDRGYYLIDEKLAALGARIRRG